MFNYSYKAVHLKLQASKTWLILSSASDCWFFQKDLVHFSIGKAVPRRKKKKYKYKNVYKWHVPCGRTLGKWLLILETVFTAFKDNQNSTSLGLFSWY